jgi:hypothetical protein
VVEHLVGLQAQTPHTWYFGLWSRIAGFRPEAAADRLVDRSLARIALIRGTIHLVTARAAHALRAAVQPVLDQGLFHNQLHGATTRPPRSPPRRPASSSSPPPDAEREVRMAGR